MYLEGPVGVYVIPEETFTSWFGVDIYFISLVHLPRGAYPFI